MKAERSQGRQDHHLERDKLRIEGESVNEDEKNTDDNKGPDEVFDRSKSLLWLAASYSEAQGYKPRRVMNFIHHFHLCLEHFCSIEGLNNCDTMWDHFKTRYGMKLVK